MGRLIDGFKNRARKWLGVDSLGAMYGGVFWDGGNVSASGIAVTPDIAMQTSAVFRCVNILANAVASMPLKVYERTDAGKSPATDYYLYKVLHDTPNRWQTSVEWRAMMEAHRCLRGNAYSLIVGGRNGFASELIPLHPDRMKIETLQNGKLRYVYTNDAGRPVPYVQEEIFHLRGLSADGVYGMSVLSAARDSIGLSRSMEDYGGKLFKNGARPSMVFSTDQSIPDKAREKLAEDWKRAHAGERAGGTAFLPLGLKPMQMGLSNDDAQFLETRKFQLSDIARFFGVPPHKIYDLERATFSNIEHQGLEFVQDTLLPIARVWEAAISRDLIADDDRYFAEFNFDFYLRGDTAARASFYKEMFYMGMSYNEICDLENRNGIGPDGDKRFVPVNMQLLEKAGEEPAQPQQPNAPQASTPPAEPDSDDEEDDMPNDAGLASSSIAQRIVPELLAPALAVYGEAAAKLLRWEADAVKRLAGKGGNFLSAVEEFYAEHSQRTLAGLNSHTRLLTALGVDPAELDPVAECNARKAAVIDAAGTCTADKLKPTIEALTETWITEGSEHAAA